MSIRVVSKQKRIDKCKNCAAVLEFERTDLTKTIDEEGDSREWIKCPLCGHEDLVFWNKCRPSAELEQS